MKLTRASMARKQVHALYLVGTLAVASISCLLWPNEALSTPQHSPGLQSWKEKPVHPTSYSTMIAGSRVFDGAVLLWSIAFAHPKSRVFVASDSITHNWFQEHSPQLFHLLDLRWSFALDAYNLSMSRKQMEKAGTWGDFQMGKARIIEVALRDGNDTIFLDADVILLSPITLPKGALNAQLGVSPHYINSKTTGQYGIYNGGMLWTNQYSLGQAWVNATRTSRFYDQAAIEDLVQRYVAFDFGEETNVGWWRPRFGAGGSLSFKKHLRLDKMGYLTYKNQTVTSLHAHFVTKDCCSKDFADLITQVIAQSPQYRNLLAAFAWAKREFSQPTPVFNLSSQP